MHVAVLGGGIVGVTSAWYLQAAGHRVTLIERQPGVALETSFANGAQLSAGHAEPWAQPGMLSKLLRWLPREDAPLLFRLRIDPAQWRWGLQFLAECSPSRFAYNLQQILALGVYSRHCHRELRDTLGLEYDALSLGILNIYENRSDFERAVSITEQVRALGYARQPMSADEAIAQEPALAHHRARLAGATWTPPDETGDAHRFCQALAQACQTAGVDFRLATTVSRLETLHGRLHAVHVQDAQGDRERLAVDACVLAMGSYSGQLLRPLGLQVPIYPMKGYSATLPLLDGKRGPMASVTDESSKMVFTRLGQRLRIAGTAEFNGYGLDLNPVRCGALVQRARQLFPGACDESAPHFWTGLRPATPSNRPLIGPTAVEGLFLNAGHGTLGWTESCGSGKAISLLVSGQRPEVAFDFLKPDDR